MPAVRDALPTENGADMADARELPDPDAPDGSESPEPAAIRLLQRAAVSVSCFGFFRMVSDGRQVDLSTVKPRARQVLRLLALHGGRPVHREVLTEAMWPEADGETGTRNLHVAISTLRKAVGPELIARDGDAYRIALPPESTVDVIAFEDALAHVRAACDEGDAPAALAPFRRAVELHTGDLLPEDGPADWVVGRREQYRATLAEAALAVAGMLEQIDPGTAVRVCEAGLRVDRYNDALWRSLIGTCERAGDNAAAARARHSYAEVLAELGLTPDDEPVSAAR
jgi:DNA-binding SARP family transcriptional activator